MKRITHHCIIVSFCFVLFMVGLLGVGTPKASALSGSEFKPGRIIDDAVFFNGNAINTNQIQLFLNSKVPTCDTSGTQMRGDVTRAAYGTSAGYPPPYTCLKNYTENVPTKSADSYCTNTFNGGNKSAAQIIADVAQACGVSPKVLIVTLQKEQSLITDDWPWSIQYRSAMGYGCPDTAECDSAYYGFFNQVYNSARQFQRYARQSNIFNYGGGRTSYVQYNPNAGCGGSNIYMESQATAGLYNFTPYQPNSSALNNLYGTGDNCGAYGNRNFWRLWNDWFGSTTSNLPFAWAYEGQQAFVDPEMTQAFTDVPTVTPGTTLYIKVRARNVGNQSWYQNVILGTTRANNRTSALADNTWWNNGSRPAKLYEDVITPGQIGSFLFTMKAPPNSGSHKEYFNILIEGQTWFNDPGLFYNVNVVQPTSPSYTTNINLPSGGVLLPEQYLLSPDRHSQLIMQADGNLVLYSNFKATWSSGTGGRKVQRAEIQGDGNIVLFENSGYSTAVWDAGTWGHPGASLSMNTNGTITMSDGNGVFWTKGVSQVPNHLSYVNPSINSQNKIYPGQELETADRRYKLRLQEDGNLVLFSPNRAIWTSGTNGQTIAFLAIQSDGNLVLYRKNFTSAWSSNTAGKGSVQLLLQADGNLILFNSSGTAIWTSKTAGIQ